MAKFLLAACIYRCFVKTENTLKLVDLNNSDVLGTCFMERWKLCAFSLYTIWIAWDTSVSYSQYLRVLYCALLFRASFSWCCKSLHHDILPKQAWSVRGWMTATCLKNWCSIMHCDFEVLWSASLRGGEVSLIWALCREQRNLSCGWWWKLYMVEKYPM